MSISVTFFVSPSAQGQSQTGVPTPLGEQQALQMPQAPISDVLPLSHHQLIWEFGNSDSWQRWWHLNQAPYLQLRRAVRDGSSEISADGLLQWKLPTHVEDIKAPTRAQKEYLILPGLYKLAEQSRNRDVHAEVMTSIARVGLFPEDNGVYLRRYLASPSVELAQTAALGLGVMESGAALENLLGLLTDDSTGRWMTANKEGVPTSLRSYAAYSIGLSAPGMDSKQKELAVNGLWNTLASDDTSVDLQASCVVALGMVQPEQVDNVVWKLLGILQAKDAPLEIRAMCPSAITRAIAKLPASHALRTEIRNTFIELMDSKHPALLRQSCVQSLGLLADRGSEVMQRDLEILEDISHSGKTLMERNFACISLAYLGASCGDNEQIRTQTARVLMQRLDSSNPEQRAWAGLALGVLGANSNDWSGSSRVDADKALLNGFLETENASEKSAMALALGLSGQHRALDPLMDACAETGNPTLRSYCAVALGLIGDTKAEEVLMKQLQSATQQPVLLERTTIGLALLGSEKATPFLVQQISPADKKTPTLATLAAAARGLALIGNARTAPHLLTAMANKNLTPLARAYAAQALGLIADKNSLPWQYRLSADVNYLAATESLLDWESGNGALNRR
ncbi:MAG: hypothetical protein HQ519_05040 [Planctomycetes bacterium]|nr:hypothetical protein [Planctomycetota bacterium]